MFKTATYENTTKAVLCHKREAQIPLSDTAQYAQLAHKISQYYDIATPGYKDWSPNINMHFGLYRKGSAELNREAMLQNTNAEVLRRVAKTKLKRVLDLGCGTGATARFAIENGYAEKVCGVTLSAAQVAQAIELAQNSGLAHNCCFARMDFHNTPLQSASFDGAYAIESACHSPQADKAALLAEAHRVLKPGARLVLCDAFLKQPEKMHGFFKWANHKVCANWALGGFGDIDLVRARMERLGFKDIQIENVTLQVLPTGLAVPWVSFKYFCKLMARMETDARYWRHLFAPLWGLLLAMDLKHFGYYIIIATKP